MFIVVDELQLASSQAWNLTEKKKYFKQKVLGLEIPTGGRLISWLFELGSTEKQLQLSAQSGT